MSKFFTIFILCLSFLVVISINIFANENRIRFSFAISQKTIQNLASSSSAKFDNSILNEIEILNKDNINKMEIDFFGTDVIFKPKFSHFEIINGDVYMIRRAFRLPYKLIFKVNKYFFYKLMAENYRINAEDLKNINPDNSKHLINIEKIDGYYKFFIDVVFEIDVDSLTRGLSDRIIIELKANPVINTVKQINSAETIKKSDDLIGIDAKRAIEESKQVALQKEQEREKEKKIEEEKKKLEMEIKEKAELERKKKQEEAEKFKAHEMEEAQKRELEEREKLELEEISQQVEKKEDNEGISTEDYLKQMLYNRRKKEIEERVKIREEMVNARKSIDLNSIVLDSLDNKIYAFTDYINKTKGIILFCWTTPEGIKNNISYLNEMVYLQKRYKQYLKKKGIEVFGIYIPHEDQNLADSELENVKKVIQRYKISYPILVDYGLVFYDKLDLKALPTTLIIDKNFKIIDIYFTFYKANQNAFEAKSMSLVGTFDTENEKLKEEIFVISEKSYSYYKYGLMLYKLGDLKASEEALMKSLYVTKKFSEPFNLMGMILTEKNNYTNASKYFLKALKLDSTNPEFYSNLGYAKLENDEIDDALFYFKKAISYNAELIQAHYGLSRVWQKKQLLPQAITEINNVLELSEKKDKTINETGTNEFAWEDLMWFNQQKCVYYERYIILNLSGDTTKSAEAEYYLGKKLMKQENCSACHIDDDLKINYRVKNKDLEDYLKDENNQKILKDIKSKDFIHRPVVDNNCMVCHTFNKRKDNFITISNAGEICAKCHKYKGEINNAEEHIHTPVKDGKCVDCHDPHSSVYSSLLKKKLVELCYNCHKEVDTSGKNHIIFKKGECVDCHVSHRSFNPALLENNLSEICFNCHQKENELYSKSVQHGPIKEGICITCHKIHGEKSNFEIENLCFDCHRKGGISVQSTSTLTSYRNGDFNLHERHTGHLVQNRPIICETCHDFHASENKSLIREGIRHIQRLGFSINYTKTENGGKCVVGCHKPREYNREKPIDPLVWK